MSKEIKTMIGELPDHFCHLYFVGEKERGIKLTKEEFEAVKLPELNEDERKYYDEVKQAENGNKIKMVGDVIYDYEYDDDHCFTTEEVYRTIEAIIKGGYNE